MTMQLQYPSRFEKTVTNCTKSKKPFVKINIWTKSFKCELPTIFFLEINRLGRPSSCHTKRTDLPHSPRAPPGSPRPVTSAPER